MIVHRDSDARGPQARRTQAVGYAVFLAVLSDRAADEQLYEISAVVHAPK